MLVTASSRSTFKPDDVLCDAAVAPSSAACDDDDGAWLRCCGFTLTGGPVTSSTHSITTTTHQSTFYLKTRPLQTVLRHSLHFPRDVPSVSVDHCPARWCRPYTLQPSVYIVHGLLTANCEQSLANVRSVTPAPPHGTTCLKSEDMRAKADAAKFRTQLKTHFLVAHLMFSDV